MDREYILNPNDNVRDGGKICYPPRSYECEGINDFFKYSGHTVDKSNIINWDNKLKNFYIEKFKEKPPENEEELRGRIKKMLEKRIKDGIGYHEGGCDKCNNCACGGRTSSRFLRYDKKKKRINNYAEFRRRQQGGKKAAKKNKWIGFLREFRKENPNLRGKKLFEVARKYYKK